MQRRELAEIHRRAALVASGSISSLHDELRSLHARNAAKGCLRSGATVKESARIADSIIRQYFDQLETFVRELPGGKVTSDSLIVDALSQSTGKLIDELWSSLRKTAALASDESLVIHIKPQVEGALVAAQETFRSNLRAHWSQNQAHGPGAWRALFGLELAFFAACLILAVMWILIPSGPYEAWAALFGLGGVGIDLVRRRVSGGAP